MEYIPQILSSGIAVGMIYAVIAFGYQLTFATSRTLNFGQGEVVALGALFGLTVSNHVGFWFAIPIVLAFGALHGVIVERIAVRPMRAAGSEYGWILSTLAFSIILKNVAEAIWGKDSYRFQSPLPEDPIAILGANVLPMELFVVVGAIAIMLAIELFNRRTIFGKAVIATSADAGAAGLMGINTGLVITFSYALSSMTAAFAGMLIAPLTVASTGIGFALGLKALAVAIIGGLTSGLGVIAGGIILGVAESATGFYLSTGYKDVPGLLLVLIVLALRPSGLFGVTIIRKV